MESAFKNGGAFFLALCFLSKFLRQAHLSYEPEPQFGVRQICIN